MRNSLVKLNGHLRKRWQDESGWLLCQSFRSEHSNVGSHLLRQSVCCVQEQGSTELCQPRRSLNPIAALAGQPEKTIVSGVKTHDKFSVDGKRSQAGPFVFDSTDSQFTGSLKTIHGNRNIPFLWLGVTGNARRFIRR